MGQFEQPSLLDSRGDARIERGRVRRLRFTVGVSSDPGRQRSENEDAYALPVRRCTSALHERAYGYTLTRRGAENVALFLVADGVGGSDAGQAASLAAVRAVVAAFYADRGARHDLALERAVMRANAEVFAAAEEAGMTGSTTLVGLLLQGHRGLVLNIGDSRAYRIRLGSIEQLTEDHSLREELLHTGELALEDGFTVPANIITRSVGRAAEVTPDIFELTLDPEDQILLCTDGLTRHVTEEELAAISERARHPQQAVEELVALANARGGKDNITAMLIRPGRASCAAWVYTALRILAILILLAALSWTAWRAFAPLTPQVFERLQGNELLCHVPAVSMMGGNRFYGRA